MRRAPLGEDFRGTLEEQTISAGIEANDDTHHFTLTVKGDHLNNLGRFASFFPVFPSKILGELKKGGLDLGPNETQIPSLRVDVLEGGVDGDRLVGQVFELRGEDGVDFGLLCRGIVSVFAICLRLVDGIGYVLFLIGCVRVDLVLFEVADELRVNTDRASHGAHEVPSEGPGLVGANNRGVGHRLAGAEDTNQEVFFGHPFRCKIECERYREGKAFRNSDNYESDGDDQDLSEGDTFLIGCTMKTC